MEELPHSDHLRGYLEILSLASQVRLSLQYRRMPDLLALQVGSISSTFSKIAHQRYF